MQRCLKKQLSIQGMYLRRSLSKTEVLPNKICLNYMHIGVMASAVVAGTGSQVWYTYIGRFLSKAEGLSQVWLQSTNSSKTGYVLALQARCFGTQHKGSQDECLFTSRLRAHDNNFSFRALLFFLTIEFKINFFHQIAIVCISGFM